MKMNECGLSLCVRVRACVLKWLSAWGLNYIQIPPLFRVFWAQRQLSGPWVIAFHACLLRTYAATTLSRTISWIHSTRRRRRCPPSRQSFKHVSCLRPCLQTPRNLPPHSSRIKSQKRLLPLQSFPHFPCFAAKRKSNFIFRLLGLAKRFSRCVECVGGDV